MKTETKHTPGPWSCERTPGRKPLHIEITAGLRHIAEVRLFEDDDHANARLIAAAPAMDLALEMLAAKVARIETSGTLREFCFNGLRYCMNGDWNALFNLIGWEVARAAITKAEGKELQVAR